MATPVYRAFFLVGPTASGKTAVAQRLAEQRRAVILSADSMLVYRGMDIGTAKPPTGDRGNIPYRGMDVVDPSESFNVARFLEEARQCFGLAETLERPVIVVGGTGLYIKALLEGLDDLPVIPEGRREYWQAVHDREGVVGLQTAVMERSPAWFDSMADHANSRRLIRALELLDAGCVVPPRSWMMEKPVTSITGLEMARAELVDRIETRVRTMYAGGLLREVRSLLDRGWSPASTAAQAIGYAEAIACLTGTVTETAAMAETARRTRQLAKRQMTWFRHQTRVSWISVAASMTLDDITAKVSSDWDQHGPQPVVLQ